MNPGGTRPAAGLAALRGLAAFGIVAASALAVAAVTAWSLGGISARNVPRLAGLQLAAFHRVSIHLRATPLQDLRLDLAITGAQMLGTVGVVWLLFRAGAAAGLREPEAPARRLALNGCVAGLTYGAACALTLVVASHFPLPVGHGSVGVAAWPGALWPLVLGVIAAVTGAVAAGMREGAAHSRIAGGWRMVTWALLGSFVAMLIVAGLDPSYSRVYFAGVRMLRSDHGVAAATHNVLLIPNASAWATTAAMGGCIAVQGSLETDLICRGRVPSGIGAEDLARTPEDPNAIIPEGLASVPLVLLVFALVPPVATVAGGIRSSRGAEGYLEAAVSGTLAGLVFCVCFTATAWFSGISFASGSEDQLVTDLNVTVGPVVIGTALVSAAWGLVGGVLGALVGLRVDRRRPGASAR